MPPTSADRPVGCDALVVGGGVTGTATAWNLARAGASVVLVERGELGSASSGANSGSLHAQIQHSTYVERGDGWARAFAPATRFMLESIALWQELGEHLGVDLEVALTGGLLVAESEAELALIARKHAIEREQGLTPELLSAADLRRVAPYLAGDLAGGELCPQEGKANPLVATVALGAAARREGARMLPRTELIGLARDGTRFVATTTAGTICASRVIDCAGTDAGAVTGMLGLPVAVGALAIQSSVTEVVAPLVGHLLYLAGAPLTIKQARAGSILIGGGWPARIRDGVAAVDPGNLLANLEVARRVVPAIAKARLLRSWTGFVNTTDDWLPIIGELPSVPGLFVGAFPYMGFTAGPLMGQVLAELALGHAPSTDVSAFAPR